jgi:hypothetical protein
LVERLGMSALCQKRTFRAAANIVIRWASHGAVRSSAVGTGMNW